MKYVFQFVASAAAGLAVWAAIYHPEAAWLFTALAVGFAISAIKD